MYIVVVYFLQKLNSNKPTTVFIFFRLSKVAMEASKKPIRPDVRNLVLEICCTDTNGEDAEVPYIKYNFR